MRCYMKSLNRDLQELTLVKFERRPLQEGVGYDSL